MYIVIVSTGRYDDHYENQQFVTNDKQIADIWVEKFNRIIDNNLERINSFDIMSTGSEPLWYDFIISEEPTAYTFEIEYR